MSESADKIFEESYRKYHDVLLKKVYVLLDDFQKSEDCVQEAYIVLYEKLNSGGSNLNIYSFLKKITFNIASKMMNEEQAMPTEFFSILGGFENAAEEKVIKDDLLSSLDRALKKQPIRNSAAVIYHYAYDKSYSQVGKLTGLSSTNAQKIIQKTSEEIADEIERKR